MVVINLAQSLKAALTQADELWISVAKITDEGLEFVQEKVSPCTIQHYLIGLDLQPPVSVLKNLHSKQNSIMFRVGIAKPTDGIFHPKLYIVRKKDSYIAFLGSANLTIAGLNRNTELCWQIGEENACKALIHWFGEQFLNSYPLNEENIRRYEQQFPGGNGRSEESTTVAIELAKDVTFPDTLAAINFNNRYFSKSDHFAFREELWENRSRAAEEERKRVHDRFLELHKEIYVRFPQFELSALYPNQEPHIVSMYRHQDGFTEKEITAMWLSYGKSPEEISMYRDLPIISHKEKKSDKLSFINHARLQIRLEFKSIGIWILF
jgi:HKD family nuclease